MRFVDTSIAKGIQMQTKKNELVTYNKTSLMYDMPLARSIPNRPLSKSEMYLIVASQYCIQLALLNKMDCLSLDFNIEMIAKARGKRLRDIRKQCYDAVASLTKAPFAQQLFKRKENGEYYSIGGFPMYKFILINDDGTIHIDINEKYAQYYQDFVMSAADLVVPYQFYMNSKSQYSYSLVNWLTACILEIRKETHEYTSKYTVRGTIEELMDVVPPTNKKMTATNYKEYVLQAAINDINNNQHSQLRIEQFDSYSAPGSRKTAGFEFTVEIFPTVANPIFLEKPASMLIDEDDTPPWNELVEYMLHLHADKGFISRMEKSGNKIRLFKAILYVLMQPINRHTGAYLNRIYQTAVLEEPILSLCKQIAAHHNEACDPVILGVIDKHEQALLKTVEEHQKTQDTKTASEEQKPKRKLKILDELIKMNPDSELFKKMIDEQNAAE